jgi:hypothetical protein
VTIDGEAGPATTRHTTRASLRRHRDFRFFWGGRAAGGFVTPSAA